MRDYIAFHMSDDNRKARINAHCFYVDQAKSRLLTQFADINTEADRVALNWLAKSEEFFDPDRHYPSDFHDAANNAAAEFHELLTDMKYRTRLSVVSGFYHDWEKQLRNWLAEQTKYWHSGKHTEDSIWRASIEEIYQLLQSFGWDLKATPWFSHIEACRLVVNVYKHGDGHSLEKLRSAYPKFLGNPHSSTGTMRVWRVREPSHKDLFVSDNDLKDFAEAVTSFWRETPESTWASRIVAPPKWLLRALERDDSAANNP